MAKPNKTLSSLRTTKNILDFFKNNTLTHEELGLTSTAWEKYLKIRDAEYLYSESVQAILPSTISSLYQLSILGKEVFKQAIEEGIVTPDVSSRKIQGWRLSRNKPSITTCIIELPLDFKQTDLAGKISDLVSRIGGTVRFKDGNISFRESVREARKARLKEAEEASTGTKDDIAALDCGHRAIHADTKQKRYAARCRLAKMAERGNHIALFLTHETH